MSFTRKQQGIYRPLVQKAWLDNCEITGTPPNNKIKYADWYKNELQTAVGVQSTKECNAAKDFDAVMLHFAIMSNDDYWMDRLARGDERRLFYQLRRFMADLEYLEKVPVQWSYIRSMWKQSKMLPERMCDIPAEHLRKLLAMLDTHIRRICKSYEIKPSELPTRSKPQSDHPVTIDPDNHYIHIGHDLDLAHTATQTELPF